MEPDSSRGRLYYPEQVMKLPFISLFIGLLLMGCSPAVSTATSPTSTSLVLPPAPFKQDLTPSPTDIQLPFDPNVSSNEYCKPPYALFAVSENNDISENEIVYELVKIWLGRYKQSNAPAFCRIDDYSIDKIYDDPGIYSQALEPRGDFMRVIAFSVKLIQIPSDWMSFAGELDQDNWLHLGHIVAITKTSEGYTMEFAYP